MGIRLQTLEQDPVGVGFQEAMCLRASHPMLSSGVCVGAIQMPPGGQAIVLCADAQTVGGYPRVAQIAAVDLPKMVQAPSGQNLLFQILTLETAEALFCQQEQKLTRLSVALKIFASG